MSSAAPIRQPRGPPSDTSSQPLAFALSPPTADADLRRANTFSTPRHQTSASVSSTLATTSAFHGSGQTASGRFKGMGRFRSGSLSSGDPNVGLVRQGSGRDAVRTEEIVVEDEDYEEADNAGLGNESFAKGLSRQSSLPSRRFANPMAAMAQQESGKGQMGPPPRPPRRIQVGIPESMSPPPPVSAHTASHSMSSLHMLSPVAPRIILDEQPEVTVGAGVSRTQSLRNQAKHSRNASLGRSSSLRDSTDQPRGHQPSPSLASISYTSPSHPPASSTAALPPFQLGGNTSDLRRHQSLNNGYSRNRGNVERTGALLSPDQRDEIRRLEEQELRRQEPPSTSPIGSSMWSAQASGNGWSGLDQLSNTFDNLNINRRFDNGQNQGYQQPQQVQQDRRGTPNRDFLPPMPMTAGPIGEPSWVAGLVGHDIVPRPRSAHTPHWQDQDMLRHQQGMLPFQHQWDREQFPMGYMQHQGQQLPGPFNMPLKGVNSNVGQYPGYPSMLGMNSNTGYMGAPMYPTPPASAHALGPQDQAVIELARSKGLNPASFNCRPPVARFFVIKSYTVSEIPWASADRQEEDVQKSLKHEIWSSTVLGKKRLDTAFREFSRTGPIYLFFSVNGSRHFCGVAEMLTPVDESQNSTVWASDKWKGIFKVKWIFVRDVPSPALRHIRLLNTPEQKPITNSRDTQELHYEAGCEVLQIFLDHQTKSKTSLLQDFAYYEQLSAQRDQSPAPGHGPSPAPGRGPSPGPGRGRSPAQGYDPSGGQMPNPPPLPQQFQPPMGPPGMVPPVPPIPARFR